MLNQRLLREILIAAILLSLAWLLRKVYHGFIIDLLLALILVPAYLIVRIRTSWRAAKVPLATGMESGPWWQPLLYELVLVIFLIWNAPFYTAGLSIFIPQGEPKSKCGAAAGDIGAMNSALALYQVDLKSKEFPVSTLMQLISDSAPGWSGPYMATITNDPWGNEYMYTGSASCYTIQSIHDSDYNKSETIRYCLGTGVMESLP